MSEAPEFSDIAFVRSVLAASEDCVKILSLDGRLTFMSEGGQKVMEIDDFAAVADYPWPSFWEGDGNRHAKDAIAAAREGRPAKFIAEANTFKGTPKWWDVSVAPIFGPDGKPAKILSVSRDTTELVQAQERQRSTLQRHLVWLARNDPAGLASIVAEAGLVIM